jgi:hypothetical protein
MAIAEHGNQIRHTGLCGQRDGGFELRQQHGMVGGIIESGLNEGLAPRGIAHRAGHAGIARDLPLIGVQKIDAVIADLFGTPAQIRQGDILRRPARDGLL